MPRIVVDLQRVVCYDPEDWIGHDEFYLVGVVTDGDPEHVSAVLTEPVRIKKGTKDFGVGGGIIFDHEVPEKRYLKVGFNAMEQDSNKDWSEIGPAAEKAAAAVSTALKAFPSPEAAAAAAVLPVAVQAVGFVMSIDRDDNLGTYADDFPVWAMTPGEHPQECLIQGSWAGTGWGYAVNYTIHVL